MTIVSRLPSEASTSPGRTYTRPIAAILLTVHASLLAWGAWRHGPTWDELAYLTAGISHWQLGRFDLCPVNPPLMRSLAALPVVLAHPVTDWRRYTTDSAIVNREVGRDFVVANGKRSFWYFTLARWACIPVSVMGGCICFWWAGRLYGPASGILALTLWCFSPNIIAHGQLAATDAGATAFGVAAAYAFWRWLGKSNWPWTFAAGLGLGLAALTKTSWIILFGLWPLIWLLCSCTSLRRLTWPARIHRGGQLLVIWLGGLYIINLGYAFEGSFRRLGDYQFVSKSMTGRIDADPNTWTSKNRFAGTWLASVRMPLPSNYVRGIDMVRLTFESPGWSYLGGEWRLGGWWYYYLYGLAIKVPLGTWILVLLAVLVSIYGRGYSSSWRDELVLLALPAVVLIGASSQTSFNHHMRYVLPIFPFAFIWASKVARAVDLRHGKMASLLCAALAWSVTSSLWVYPHSLSYFSELVGGPKGGHAHLHDSNIDWGQDLLYLKRWLDEHPEACPVGLVCFLPRGLLDPQVAGIEYTLPPLGPEAESCAPPDAYALGPQPGWYAISVCHLHGGPWGRYTYFLHFRPVAMAGYSIYIYHITLDEANRIRGELGLPKLPGPQQPR